MGRSVRTQGGLVESQSDLVKSESDVMLGRRAVLVLRKAAVAALHSLPVVRKGLCPELLLYSGVLVFGGGREGIKQPRSERASEFAR